MPRISKLPITVESRPSELFAAYMARCADTNLYSPQQLCKVLRAAGYDTGSEKSEQTETQALSRMLFALGNPVLAEPPTTAAGFTLRNWSGRTFKQICPRCLEADATHTHAMTDKAWAVCLLHGVAHLTHCPHCHTRLSWGQGSYFQCGCGYDLRAGPLVSVSKKLLCFLAAIASNRPPDAVVAPVDIEDIWAARNRFKSAFAYLTGGLTRLHGTVPQEAAQAETPFVHFWDEVMQVVAAAGGLTDAVRAIEFRLALAGRAGSNAAVREGHRRRSEITWKHLSELAGAAMAAAPRLEKHTLQLTTRAGLRVSADLAALRVLPAELSAPLRAALDNEIRKYFDGHDACVESARQRIDAVVDLARNLRPLRSPDWMRSAFDDIAQVLSLIACGVLAPWGPSHVRSWHVLASDVAEIVRHYSIIPCSEHDVGPNIGYRIRHSSVFDSRGSVLEWARLSKDEVVERVSRLLPSWEETVMPWKHQRSMLTGPGLPFGLSYFLEHPWVKRFGVDGDPKLNNCQLLASDLVDVREALVGCWEAAIRKLAQLQGWERDSALAAQQVLHSCLSPGNPIFCSTAAIATLPFKAEVDRQLFASILNGFLGTKR